MSCYLEFLFLEKAVIGMNVIYPCWKRSIAETVCLNKSLLRIWRVYISYVMLTIALRVKVNKIPPIPPYFSKM
jgi:hypothetical protein